MSPQTHDDFGRVFISSTHSTHDVRDSVQVIQQIHSDFFYEDEERNVWATPTGSIIYEAIKIAKDPLGRFRDQYKTDPAMIRMKNHGKEDWVTFTIADAIQRCFTKTTLIALAESMQPSKASYYVASEAINLICREWLRADTMKSPKSSAAG
jgi:hypothetical protein